MKRIITILALVPVLAIAQTKVIDKSDLYKDKVPQNFYQQLPAVSWEKGNVLQVIEHKPGKEANRFALELPSGKSRSLTPQVKSLESTKELLVKDRDLYLKSAGGLVQLTKDTLTEQNPMFSPDSNYVAYTKGNNLYTYNLKTSQEKQLTTDGTNTILNGYATWVYWEEIYGRPTRFRAYWWSPDSKKIAFMRFDESKVPMFPLYVSEGQHGHLEETRYPKAGDPNPTAQLGFISPEGGATTWADFNPQEDQYFSWPSWLSDGSGLLIQWITRGNDHLKIYNVSPTNGSKKALYEERQKTWIDISDYDSRLTVLEESKEMIIASDKTGWNQLALYGLDGTFKNDITSGKFTVTSIVGIDKKKRVVYFQARGKENTARFDLYRVDMTGKNLKRLTFGDYNHRQISASPDFSYFVTTYSNVNTPLQMAVIDNNGKVIRQLGSMAGESFKDFKLAKTELIRIKSDDGLYDLPMLITYPNNMKEGEKYPVLVSIYGGPNAGTVYDQWNWNTQRELLAEEGLIQVALDHRASGHFGKEGLNYLHRNLGYWEMKDYSTMVRHLINRGIADPERIGITGFSYGGYMSAYALTYGSDLFTHGMAGGSVTDWKYYDTAYTERYMDTPQDNPEGYKTSSVLTHVEKYKGWLQIVHGTMDDNVHLQNSLQLVNDLQNANKEFEMMFYPGGRHGWGGNKGKHYSNLKTRFIYKHLLRKPIPNEVLK